MAIRVYEFSKKSGISNKELVELLIEKGFDIQSHMSLLSDEALSFLESHFQKKNAPKLTTKKAAAGVAAKASKSTAVKAPSLSESTIGAEASSEIKNEKKMKTQAATALESQSTKSSQSSVHGDDKNMQQQKTQQKSHQSSSSRGGQKAKPHAPFRQQPVLAKKPEPIAPIVREAELVIEPMTVGEFAEKAQKPLSEVILTLMKKGIIAAKNQVLSVDIVGDLARLYEIKILQPVIEQKADAIRVKAEGFQEERWPVVVVIGHVDHGKTTLLDQIRKTRVAAREKGGITQHLGAYEVKTQEGTIVFLDTPGHEAFSLMRSRGIKVADIAILVVAADDGVMPQTIEAIKSAQQLQVPIIVALNKIDKATPQQIEAVKRSLVQYDLTPEDWGGQTVVMPISAKLGQGVSELLDVISLQAQLFELKVNKTVAAQGFVLESKLEKGLGAVATVICQQGTLHVGDSFFAGTTFGKVTSLVNSFGQRIQSAGPSVPVQVAGFEELAKAGDAFDVVSIEEVKKARQNKGSARVAAPRQATQKENSLNIIIKADNMSSCEAITNSLKKLSGKAFKEFYIIHSGVGQIIESDITLAADTKALIYGFHVKVESGAAQMAQKLGVDIKLFDIIYKLLEDLAVVADQGKPVKKVLKKIGEAIVLKVFDIKNLGVIAGAQVKSGRFVREGKVTIWRGKYKVGAGPIKSLQRDKKSVKEVHTGFECAFMVDGFIEWQPEDRVECYLEVAEDQA